MDASVHLCTEQRTMEMDRIFLLLAAAGLVLACNPQSYFEKRGEAVDTGTNTLTHGMIVLGDKLQDPYSVDNVQIPSPVGLMAIEGFLWHFLFCVLRKYGYIYAKMFSICLTKRPIHGNSYTRYPEGPEKVRRILCDKNSPYP